MSATRLSSTSTTTMPAYMGSLRLAAVSEPGRIDKEFGSSSLAFSCSSSSSSDLASSPSPYTVPPRGALVFQQHVHRIPKPMRPSQKFKLWYRGIFWETLEPWENILVHALLIALVSILYFAVSRVFAPSHVARLTSRAQWYLTGVAVASNPANSTSWPQL
ncbi:hypothetical protein RHOSPDRAFT_33877 [Rhodotorula sp. JG-1b]|nr:hypothetical protein RHOSPDRAFT_33877 [Rhodotorula sp. JG-1b]